MLTQLGWTIPISTVTLVPVIVAGMALRAVGTGWLSSVASVPRRGRLARRRGGRRGQRLRLNRSGLGLGLNQANQARAAQHDSCDDDPGDHDDQRVAQEARRARWGRIRRGARGRRPGEGAHRLRDPVAGVRGGLGDRAGAAPCTRRVLLALQSRSSTQSSPRKRA